MLTALLAGLWLLVGPATADLAAQLHRVGLFAANGFAVWDNSWYGGHHLPGYSLVFPAVGAAVGVRLAGASAAVASAALFDALVAGRGATAARWWFAVGCSADLLIGRMTYALGVSFGLAAVFALVHHRPRSAAVLALGCAATSPVAGLFLALVCAALWIVDRHWAALVTGLAALAGVVALSVAFPEGGSQPFSWSSFAVTLSISLAAAVAVGRRRHLRVALVLYAAAAVLCFVIASPMGGNITRLGTAFAAPVLLVAAATAPAVRRVVLLLILCAAAAWQWIDPITQAARGWDDPSAASAYYQPLVAKLRAVGATAGRVEVPFTQGHWETVYLARRFALARGWERQLDRRLNPLFYDHRLTPAVYDRWLRANAVDYVALPDTRMDPSGRTEAAMVRRGAPFLQQIWAGRHWRLYRVLDPLALGSGRAGAVRLTGSGVRVEVRRPGSVLLRVHWTPYWDVTGGRACVSPRAGWTLLKTPETGTFTLTARFSVARLVQDRPGCAVPGP
ncbi:hypothetical protein FSW04_21370 [Baekduia soli]|uniref:Integral membrane protein n=1 Tax=Baekduia soli TaxID=496014 RepID=A0A5B8U9Z9_9ACTN|nr:hypothetical protein [Baekduia soli]QEC49865.1 hypothetical protein FSW04_21370 [Baekduia soli]